MEVRSLAQPPDVAAEFLAAALVSAQRLDVASAFVTRGGFELLASWPRAPTIRLIARAGRGPTDTHAVTYAADELGVDVRLVAGPTAATFHPKLYLVHQAAHIEVLSGSGNLTNGGLTSNVEQFEWLKIPRGNEELDQLKRFDTFWKRGLPLSQLRGTAWWDAWLAASDELSGQLEHAADALLDQLAPAMPDADAASAPVQPKRLARAFPDADIPGCLDRWLPEAHIRAMVCGFFADAIEAHHAMYPKGWAVLILDPGWDGRFRFQQMSHNVDRFRLRDDGALIVGVQDRELAERLGREHRGLTAHIDQGPYRTHDLTIPANVLPRVIDEIRAPALDLVTARRAIVRSYQHSSHRALAIQELERVTGRALPQPDYS